MFMAYIVEDSINYSTIF